MEHENIDLVMKRKTPRGDTVHKYYNPSINVLKGKIIYHLVQNINVVVFIHNRNGSCEWMLCDSEKEAACHRIRFATFDSQRFSQIFLSCSCKSEVQMGAMF